MRIFFHDGDRRLRAATGYGQLAAGLAQELPRLGHELVFAPASDVSVCLHICPPSSMNTGAIQQPQAAFTMHETESLPESKQQWIQILNDVELVLTPTDWNRRIWKSLGVETPIEVVPLGVDADVYKLPKTEHFSVLCAHENLGSESSRENWRDTIRAYYGAFAGRDDVELIIKTWRWKPAGFEQAKAAVCAELDLDAAVAPPVTVIDDDLTSEQMRDLYQRTWLFLKNANREGWGLPATEALASGAEIAASRIQPLVSHLPDDVAWFAVGDHAALKSILIEHDRLATQRRVTASRFTWERTAATTSAALMRFFT